MFPRSVSIFGLELHLYGVVIGLGIIVALNLIQKRATKLQLPSDGIQMATSISLAFGLIGARLWHVVTDYHLYVSNFLDIFKIWQGGLSILGGILFGVIGLWVSSKYIWREKDIQFLQLTDLASLGIPFGQAIGRWGNYINRELFGWPTSLPWGIFIPEQYRPARFVSASHYHPLFLYESIAMVLFGWWLWKRKWQVGSGRQTLAYISFYSFVRFILDFFRIEKAVIFGTILGFNQLVLLVVGCWSLGFLLLKDKRKRLIISGISVLILCYIVSTFFYSINSNRIDNSIKNNWSKIEQVADHQQVDLSIGQQSLRVEVVHSVASITRGLSGRDQIGSDGMLFVFNRAITPSFWMKEMKFDLDLVWIKNGTVIGITPNVPHPSPQTPLEELPTYTPPDVVTAVLEIPAGTADKRGIQVGDQVGVNFE